MNKRRECARCGKNRAERFYSGPKGRVCFDCQKKARRTTSRRRHVQSTYSLTADEHALVQAEQGPGCAICHRTPRYSLEVDHDHQMERILLEGGYEPTRSRRQSVRGLLCKMCNRRILPAAKDDPNILRAAAEYLERPPAFRVLGAGDAMSFKDGSWSARYASLGDEAEQVFKEVAPANFIRYGLNRPPLQLHKIPARIRYTPDYLMSNKFVEVQGLGRDQTFKLKFDKYGALRWWNDLHPVEMFVWDSHHQRWCFLSLDEIDGLIGSGQVTLASFPEGKSYFTFPAKLLFESSAHVGEHAPRT